MRREKRIGRVLSIFYFLFSIFCFLFLTSSAHAQTVIYYSVGTNESALYSGDASATAGTMTLGDNADNNIGVGDEVRVGDDRYYIAARNSATSFDIQNSSANGGTPGSTAITFASQPVQIYRAFNALSDAVSGTVDANHLNLGTMNLVTGDYQLNWTCYADGPDTTDVIVAGYTTDATRNIKIYTPTETTEVGASQRHSGVRNTGYTLRPEVSDPIAVYSIFYFQDEFTTLEGIEIDGSDVSNAENFYGIVMSCQEVYVDSCIIHGIQNSTTDDTDESDVAGIYTFSPDAYVQNSLIYDVTNVSTHASSDAWGIYANGVSILYNNTVLDIKNTGSTSFARGIAQDTYVVVASNNYVGDVSSTGGSEACFSGSFHSDSTNNVSSDTTATTASGLSGGVGNQSSYATYFHNVNAGLQDLHLENDSNSLWGSNGTDLDTDLSLAVTVDIDAETRNATAPDIGADEYNAAYTGIGAYAGTAFVWDSDGVEKQASESVNWDNDTLPGAGDTCTINTTDDTIDWDVASVANSMVNTSFTGRVAQSTNVVVSSALNVQTGIWDMVSYDLDVASLTVANGALFHIGAGDLTIRQSLALGATATCAAEGSTSTVYFNATDTNNTITGGTLVGNVVFTSSGSATWTLGTDFIVDGDVTIESGCTFDLDTYDLTCSGTLVVEGTLDASSSAELWVGNTLDNSSGTISTSAALDFYCYTPNFEERWTLLDDIVITGDMTIAPDCTVDQATFDITVSGNMANSGESDPGQGAELWVGGNCDMTGGVFTYGTSNVVFYGGNNTSFDPDDEEFNAIFVRKLALSDYVTVSDTLSMVGSLLVEEGTFFTNSELTLNGSMIVSSGAAFTSLGAGETLFFNEDDTFEYTIHSGATVTWQGALGNNLYLRSTVDGYRWKFECDGTKNIRYVDVKDSDATDSTHRIDPEDSEDSGNTVYWFPTRTGLFEVYE